MNGVLIYTHESTQRFRVDDHSGGFCFYTCDEAGVQVPGSVISGNWSTIQDAVAGIDDLMFDAPAPMKEPDFFVACVVLQDKAYGGSEEGGWWYDTYSPQMGGDIPLPKFVRTREEAEAHCDQMSDWCVEHNEGRPSTSSVLSEGLYTTMIYEGEMPCHLPKERPCYE